MRREFVCGFVWAAFGVVTLGWAAAGVADTLADLPVYDEAEAAYDGDWLVARPAQEAGIYRLADGTGLVLCNGLISRTIRVTPDAATVGFRNLTTGENILRGVKPEASVTLNGVGYAVGGLHGQPNYAFLRPEWIDALEADPAALHYVGFEVSEPAERMGWKQVRHHAPNVGWPPKGVHLRMDYRGGEAAPSPLDAKVTVSVHYELYDGVPVLSKWLTVANGTDRAIRVDAFTSEILAAVEYASTVEHRTERARTPNIHVETDYAFAGMCVMNTSRLSVHWVPDPDYATQVDYLRLNPCLLEVRPKIGPAIEVAPGGVFESFRVFLLPYDGYNRERNGLAQRQLYRTVAPWSTENPLMMHVRYADWDTVKNAIDQCAAVGFEMVILTFGSGFNIEDDSDEYIAKMREYADYARDKGIEIGGYSLLASRGISKKDDVVMPEGQSPTFGHSPCLLSEWGIDYFRKLYAFYEKTGFRLLEHDGSYPGDVCMSREHPGHDGLDDSRWKQWRKITDFYKWCRGEGIYLNVPDYYYLSGSNKCGMGYREVNWSLPRSQQVIHTRQNIYDGTWEKTPSMGWMFVPLTEYHGGGEAATIEPLDEHLDHYERMLISNLAYGVQACYRGPRLYDTDRTMAVVKRWVDWYKAHRDILESDVIHGRRADGQDLDWMLHVNPTLEEKGMLVVFNPLERSVKKTLPVNLYYTGLDTTANVYNADGKAQQYTLDRDYSVQVHVEVPARGFAWYVIK